MDKQIEYHYRIQYEDLNILNGVDGRWEFEKIASIIGCIIGTIDHKFSGNFLITYSELPNDVIKKAYIEYGIIFSLIEIKDLVYKEVNDGLQNLLASVTYHERFDFSEDILDFIRYMKKHDKSRIIKQ